MDEDRLSASGSTGGSPPRSWRSVTLLLTSFLAVALCTQLLAAAAPQIASAWDIDVRSLAAPMAAGWIGAGVGTVLGGIAGDRIGRRWSVIVAIALSGGATFGTVLTTDPGDLAILRLFAGVGLGGCYPPALALLTESVAEPRRGMMVSLAMVAGPLGIAACSLLAMAWFPDGDWKGLFAAVGIALLALAAVLVILLPESPHFTRGVGHAVGRSGRAASTVAPLFAPEHRGKTLRLAFCFASVFIAVAAVLSWIPALLAVQGLSPELASGSPTAWSIGGIIGSLVAGWMMTRRGALAALQLFAVGGIGGFLLLAIAPVSAGLLLALLGLVGLLLSAMITCAFGYATACYPDAVRATGVGFADMIGRVGAVAGSFGGVFLIDAAGASGFYIGLAALLGGTALVLVQRRVSER